MPEMTTKSELQPAGQPASSAPAVGEGEKTNFSWDPKTMVNTEGQKEIEDLQHKHKGQWSGMPEGKQNVRQPTKENFPHLNKKQLEQLKKAYPEGVHGEAGAEADSMELIMNLV